VSFIVEDRIEYLIQGLNNKAAGTRGTNLAHLPPYFYSSLPNDDCPEWASLNAGEATATQSLIDIGQFVRLELDQRFQPAGLSRHTLAAGPAFLGIHARNAIFHSDHIASCPVVGNWSCRHAIIPPARL
jgi:hypothetical protein